MRSATVHDARLAMVSEASVAKMGKRGRSPRTCNGNRTSCLGSSFVLQRSSVNQRTVEVEAHGKREIRFRASARLPWQNVSVVICEACSMPRIYATVFGACFFMSPARIAPSQSFLEHSESAEDKARWKRSISPTSLTRFCIAMKVSVRFALDVGFSKCRLKALW